jgi:lipoic acid synthetase
MIMGTNCTRNCRFCDVRYDLPQQLDPEEPRRVAQAVKELELKYVVVTSVTRDDLSDGGAAHFAKVIAEIKHATPETAIEVLIPDFKGSIDALKVVTDAFPNVISHNMETVKSLYSVVRPQAQYNCSLELLRNIKLLDSRIHSKSGIMVGLGETKDEIFELFDDLLEVGCEFLTIGQYLSPSKQHLSVQEYIEPSQFEEYGLVARKKGFKFVASAPLVRSSFNAGEALMTF